MSKDDELLKALGRAARAREHGEDAALLEAVAAGEIGVAEAVARRPDLDARALEALLSPLDEGARARIAARLSPPARTRTGPRRRVLAAALVLTAAAAAWLLFPRSALPRYELDLAGGDVTIRGGATQGPRTFSRGSRVDLRLRPAVPSAEVTDARLFVLADGTAVPARLAPQRSAEGAFRWAATAEELLGPVTGELDLVIVVGRAPLPSADTISEALARGHASPALARDVQSLRMQVRVVP
jgi:hypothetical protein